MKDDCKWLNDVECPYASGYEKCEGCDKYEIDDRPHPLDDSDRGCEKDHMIREMEG